MTVIENFLDGFEGAHGGREIYGRFIDTRRQIYALALQHAEVAIQATPGNVISNPVERWAQPKIVAMGNQVLSGSQEVFTAKPVETPKPAQNMIEDTINIEELRNYIDALHTTKPDSGITNYEYLESDGEVANYA